MIIPAVISLNGKQYPVTGIGFEAFRSCTSLKKVTLPDRLTAIGNSAFYNCTSLTEVSFPGSLTAIGMSAFSYCASLTEVTLPSKVNSIGQYAFSFCSSLRRVYYDGSKNDWNNNVSKENNWNYGVAADFAVVCTPRIVTFRIANGSWNNGGSQNITVPMEGFTNFRLSAEDIPEVGGNPAESYNMGHWDITPSTSTDILDDVTFTYTYAQEKPISATVVFQVVNGSWDDETLTGDQTVTLTRLEGDTLKLAANDIPAVGGNPDTSYKAGSWNSVPGTETAFANGSTTTYVYTYAQKDQITATVVFQVVNGGWNDETLTGDQTVTLTGFEGDSLKLASGDIPAVGNKPNDTFKAGAWDVTPSTETAITASTTYTYTYAQKDQISVTVTLKVVHGAWGDGTRDDKTIVLTGYEGDELRLEASDIPKVTKPDEGYEFGSGAWTPEEPPIILQGIAMGDPITEDITYTYTYAAVIAYTTVSGDGQEYRINSNDDLTFTVKRSVNDEVTFPNFRSAALDGQGLNAGEYDTAQGSLIFTLKAANAKTLALGAHTLTFTFTDGTATAAFTVKPMAGSFEDVAVASDTFTFKKVWDGGPESGISFTLYKQGGEVYHHGFDKTVVSQNEWQYRAWFSSPAACYVIEEPIPGYITRYENVGVYAQVTDRCCDGGTIINKKIPKTGDEADLTLWAGCVAVGLLGIGLALTAGRRRKARR